MSRVINNFRKTKKKPKIDNVDHQILEIPSGVYFNLIKKGIIQESAENIVNIETGQVTLHPDLIIIMEIGAIIGRIMVMVRKSAALAACDKLTPDEMKERFQPLDPNLGNLKETDTPINRHQNWTLVCRELRKFGIIVEPKIKDKLVIGDQSLLKNLIPMLMKYEHKKGKIKEFKILEMPEHDKPPQQQTGADNAETIIQPVGLPPKPTKKGTGSKANLNSSMSQSQMSSYHSILMKRSFISSSAQRDLFRSLDAKPRELYTDLLIKNKGNMPAPTSYHIKIP